MERRLCLRRQKRTSLGQPSLVFCRKSALPREPNRARLRVQRLLRLGVLRSCSVGTRKLDALFPSLCSSACSAPQLTAARGWILSLEAIPEEISDATVSSPHVSAYFLP